MTTANELLPKNLVRFMFLFLKPYPLALSIAVLLAVISGTYGTINAYLTKTLIDNLSQGVQETELWAVLFWPALYFVFSYEVHNLSWRGIQYISLQLGPKLQNTIIKKMFAYTEKNSFQFFQNNFSGTIASNISTLADNIVVMVTNIAPFLVRQIIQTILALVSMFFINAYFCTPQKGNGLRFCSSVGRAIHF